MKCETTIKYLKCRALRADLNFDVDFGVNGAIGGIVTSGILFYLDNGSFSSIIQGVPKVNTNSNSDHYLRVSLCYGSVVS